MNQFLIVCKAFVYGLLRIGTHKCARGLNELLEKKSILYISYINFYLFLKNKFESIYPKLWFFIILIYSIQMMHYLVHRNLLPFANNIFFD